MYMDFENHTNEASAVLRIPLSSEFPRKSEAHSERLSLFRLQFSTVILRLVPKAPFYCATFI